MAGSPNGSVRSSWARYAALELKAAGIDVNVALAEAQLTWPQLNKPDSWILYVRHARLLEIASRELEDDHYGLSLAQRVDVRDGDLLAYLGIASDTIETALQNMSRYSRVLSEAIWADLDIDGDSGTLTFTAQEPSLSKYRQAAEFRHTLLLAFCRYFTGRRIFPLSVHFIHERRQGREKIAGFFKCPVKFGQRHEQMTFSRKVLAAPVTSADYRLLRILRNHAENLLRSRPKQQPEIIDRLERRLTELLSSGNARAKVIAADLGMSERTLLRRLAEHDTSFSQMVERLRHDLALKYLSEQNLSLTQIAFLLGYSNQSAFTTACRRWTGRPPRELRAA